jgi:hyperosmotically inducible periplasmic protein
MKSSSTAALAALAAGLFLGACEESSNPPSSNPSAAPKSTSSSESRPDKYTPPKDADNTAQNKSDRDSANPTPMDQSQSKEDVRITADIRKALMDDLSLSMNAHNCKIITDKGGVVTLRGVVETQAEKDLVEMKTKAVQGVTSVTNLLEVKGG